jgi:hypothetical protein
MPKVIYKPLDRLDPIFEEAPTRYSARPVRSQAAAPERKNDNGKPNTSDHHPRASDEGDSKR